MMMAQTNYRVVENSFNKVVVHFNAGNISTMDVSTDEGPYSRMTMDGYHLATEVGKPQVPVMVNLLEIPLCDGISYTIRSSRYSDFTAAELGIPNPLFPAQPSYTKSHTGSIEFIKDAETYRTNAFYHRDLITVEKTGIMRSINIATVYFSPVQYNPVTNTYRIYEDVTVEFTWSDDNELIIEYLASTNKKTIVNLTHHAFFSLAGTADPTPTIEDQICEINADFYLPTDATAIPTGEILKVEGTPFDFRTPKPFGKDINADHEQIKFGKGFDHNYVLNKREEGELSFAAKVTEPKSGRTMEVFTTEPGMQLYTANYASGYKGANGCTFPFRSAVCFEAQHFPDTPNRPYFPSVVLNPGQRYKQKTIYRFGIAE